MMDDLEITRRCAEKMGLTHEILMILESGFNGRPYNPLKNDDEAMALVKKFKLTCMAIDSHTNNHNDIWDVSSDESIGLFQNPNLNRAICECVANLPD